MALLLLLLLLLGQNKTIGSGGYGVVVSAVNIQKETKVAVKKVVSAFDDMLVAKRMIREIRLLRQFDHDNIIRIVDMLPPPSVDKFKDVYMVLDRMDTVRSDGANDDGRRGLGDVPTGPAVLFLTDQRR